jgi:two-component system cell cycle sensor histidine kinase/response regulator CckA
MKELRMVLRLLLIGALLLTRYIAAAEAPELMPSVIIISSYHQGFAWSDEELRGLLSRLREVYPGIDPPVEHLDTKRFSSPSYMAFMKDKLKRKYDASPVDLVVALDNPALDMLMRYRSELFPRAPIVFAGVSDFSPAMLPAGARTTGVAEISDVAGTLRLALDLFPLARHVLLVNDYSVSGRAVQHEAEVASVEFRKRVSFRSLPPSTFEEAANAIADLPSDSVVLLLSYSTDRSGRTYSLAETTRIFVAGATVPVFGAHETRLGYGIVGGSLLQGSRHGRRAGDIALRVLGGEDPSRIPVDFTGTSLAMFDYKQLARFHVPLRLLPSGSVVVNRPETVFRKYPAFSLITSGAVAVLILLVVLLASANLRRKRAEGGLRRSEANLTALIENTEDLIASRDAQGRLVAFNASFARTVREIADVQVQPGMTGREYLPDSMREPLDRLVAGALKGQLQRGEITGHVHGGTRIFEVSLYPIRADSAVIGAAEFVRDITERRKAEQALRESEAKLVQSHKMEAIGRLAGGIAHDFNNLLTVITGYASLAIDRVANRGDVPEELSEIRKSAQKAATLTGQMLAFSRRQVLQPKVFNLNVLIVDMTRMLRRLIGEDIELSVTLQEGVGNIRADPAQIEQVLMNIVINARDAMPEGGTVRVETREVESRAGLPHAEIPAGHYVVLSIADSGKGMDGDTLSRIFEPFFTTKEKGRGTGLGLSTAYGIVKQSGGWIYCTSRPGEGATFSIWLPRVAEEVEETKTVTAAPAPLGGAETILLVEDDKSVRRFLSSVLASAGYTVREASDGKEAIVALREGPAALVVTDMVMPHMGGRELTNIVRQEFPGTRLLITSGYLSDPATWRWIMDDRLRLLQKPFGPRELLAAVRESLDEPSLPPGPDSVGKGPPS